MTNEEKKADLEKRKKDFEAGLKELYKTTELSLKAQLNQDGPLISIIDEKQYPSEEEVPVLPQE
jgi:hypothetical protein